jgi:acyl-CoA synthetase (AMP-forming)/AMP-acid ligase II
VSGATAERADVIVAVAATRQPVAKESLRDHLRERLPDWQVPREWRFVESLSANARGKISRAEWRRRYSGEG